MFAIKAKDMETFSAFVRVKVAHRFAIPQVNRHFVAHGDISDGFALAVEQGDLLVVRLCDCTESRCYCDYQNGFDRHSLSEEYTAKHQISSVKDIITLNLPPSSPSSSQTAKPLCPLELPPNAVSVQPPYVPLHQHS